MNMRRLLLAACLSGFLATPSHAQTNLWQLAEDSASFHRFATLFTAQDVLHCLTTDAGSDAAVEWCKASGITHVFLEEFRDGYQAERDTLQRARDAQGGGGLLMAEAVGKGDDPGHHFFTKGDESHDVAGAARDPRPRAVPQS